MGEKTPVKEQSTRSQGLGLPASADAKGYVGEVFISSNEEDAVAAAAGGESGDFVHHLQLKGGGGGVWAPHPEEVHKGQIGAAGELSVKVLV